MGLERGHRGKNAGALLTCPSISEWWLNREEGVVGEDNTELGTCQRMRRSTNKKRLAWVKVWMFSFFFLCKGMVRMRLSRREHGAHLGLFNSNKLLELLLQWRVSWRPENEKRELAWVAGSSWIESDMFERGWSLQPERTCASFVVVGKQRERGAFEAIRMLSSLSGAELSL